MNDQRTGRDVDVLELLDLRIPAESAGVAEAADKVTETLTRLSVPEEKRLVIGLAVQEALANAVVHGCGNDPSKEVRCQVKTNPIGLVLIIVTDPGPGFTSELLPDPSQQESLQMDHGRGVYLIRQLMDEVQFVNGGNEIRMWKY
ncbi:MAG TPA: ATP-binding protein [Terriglobales bacterium]